MTDEQKTPDGILFNIKNEQGQHWVMAITEQGILFNRESFPNAGPDDFAQAVMKIMEQAKFSLPPKWIAKSERMPDVNQRALFVNLDHDDHIDDVSTEDWEFANHWLPLPDRITIVQ